VTDTLATDPAALLDVRAVARLLGCSTRHVHRLAERDHLPPPVRLGRLLRWRPDALADWIAAGCPPCATGRAAP
jgi:predicted DNA-binding transcriptional regulator AlpA